jgi:predicted metalloprotease with PDZ domain
MMKTSLGIAAAMVLLTGAVSEKPHPLDIAYRVSVPEPASHRYEIEIAVNGIRDDTLVLQMPVWSPGRYGRMDFARNVQHFAVTDAKGAPVAWELVNGSRWRLRTKGVPAVRVSYRVFANALSGTFSVADTAHLNWNGASLFAYVVGHKPDPVRLTILPPLGWHVINGASLTPDQTEFRFANYDFLIDTPTEVAPAFNVDSFSVDGRLYRAVTHLNGGDDHGQRARFVSDLEKIVRYENTVMGPPPIPMYTFLFNIGYAGGDGMEHLASTQIITSRMWSDSAARLPGVSSASHEYFHVWNVKRIRPFVLGPFDYENAQFEPSLWVAEGWTNYYGDIGLLRAGLESRAAFYTDLGNQILGYDKTPSRKWVTARMASIAAPYWDGAPAPMPVETWEGFISYYSQGEALALLLDLEIRSRTGGRRSLDDALRNLKKATWDAPSTSYYLQGRGYTEMDVERAVSEAAGVDLHAWFERFVGGTEELPFAASLALVGMRVTTRMGADVTVIVDEDPAATPAQVALRDQWLAGTTSGAK